MLGGSRAAAHASRGAILRGSDASRRTHNAPIEALVPSFLCPAIETSLPSSSGTSLAGPSTSRRHYISLRQSPNTLKESAYGGHTQPTLTQCRVSRRSYASHSAAATRSDDNLAAHGREHSQQLIWQQNHHAAYNHHRHSQNDVCQLSRQSPKSSSVSQDWRRKFPSTRWRREMDFNRYSAPLRRRHLPEDAPALYDDEIKASTAWLPESQWTLSVPDDYPLRHELFLILDSLDDIAQSTADPDCSDMLVETLRQARQLIWSNPDRPLRRRQDQDAALFLAGKVAETYVKLDAEDTMDRLMAFLQFVRDNVGILPMACFHALAAQAGIIRRYDVVLKICQVAQADHKGKADAELLHLRLRGLIAESKGVDLTRYWDSFAGAGVPVPRKTFDLLLRTFVRRQDVAQVNQLLEAMPQHGFEVDAKAWLTILRGFQTFRPSLAAMLRRDAKIVQSPTLDVVNRLLLLLSKEIDVDGALMVLRIFRIQSIDKLNGPGRDSGEGDTFSIINGPSPKPNAQTYAILTQMFGRLGRYHEALPFFRLALVACGNQVIDAPTEKALQDASASVMSAFLNGGQPVRAMSFATQVLALPYFGTGEGKDAPAIDFGLGPTASISVDATSAHYRILLECASALGSADTARRVVVHLLEQGRLIDQDVLRGIARLVFSTIDADALESIHVIRNLLARKGDETDGKREQRLGPLSDMLEHLGATERVTLASHHATDLNRHGNSKASDKPAAKHSGLQGQNRLKQGSTQPTTRDELREWLIRDSSSLFSGLSLASAEKGDDPALAQDLSRPLSPEAYAMRIRVYAVVRRDHESAEKVYHAMLAHGVRPTMMHIAPLIEGLTAMGHTTEAQRLKRNAREVTGVQPTLRIHTALIRAYVRAGDSKSARNELQELTNNGYQIDDTISNIIEAAQSGRHNFALIDRPLDARKSHSVATRFHALMRLKRYLAAQELIQSALDSGMHPDKVLHDLVRRSASYLQKQHLNAMKQSTPDGAVPVAYKSHSPAMSQTRKQPLLANTRNEVEETLHVYELAQAVRLALQNKKRIAKPLQKGNEDRRKKMKEHRKKVIALVLEWADGKLHQEAAARVEAEAAH